MLITEFGLDASTLKATGPRGTLLKGDVLAAIKSGIGSSSSPLKDKMPPPPIHSQASPSASPETSHLQQSESFEDIPNSQIRKVSFI